MHGITLIALIVTVVVLLILATVSISMIIGRQGLFDSAQDAKNKTNEATQNDLQAINDSSDEVDRWINGE